MRLAITEIPLQVYVLVYEKCIICIVQMATHSLQSLLPKYSAFFFFLVEEVEMAKVDMLVLCLCFWNSLGNTNKTDCMSLIVLCAWTTF